MNFTSLLGVYVLIFTREVNCSAQHRYSFKDLTIPADDQTEKPADDNSKKSVDDKYATEDMFPYNAGIFGTNNSFCGGALIAPRWVLTSAWCLTRGPVWLIMLGSLYYDRDVHDEYRRLARSIVAFKHPLYSDTHYENDIGLLKLPCAADLNRIINIIALPSKCSLHDRFLGASIRVIGWMQPGKYYSRRLRYDDHKTARIDGCGSSYDPPGSYFCSKSIEPEPDTYGADHGGPGVHVDVYTEKPILVGIVSYRRRSYFKLMRTAYYLDWIQKVTNVDTQDC